MAEAFLNILLQNLNSLILKELGLLCGVDEQLKKLSSTLSTIQAVLQDAEEKQVTNKPLQNWLKKLKDAAYDADDILDEFATKASQLECSQSSARSIVNKVSNGTFLSTNCIHPGHILFRPKIASRLKQITERIDAIAGERLKFHLQESVAVPERRVSSADRRQTMSVITQPQIYGREEDKEKVVECLVKHVAERPDLSVYPVVGMGGLGKTTLAQMVFNDERVCRHFELRIWVCVSDPFDLKRVIKAVTESASGNPCEDMDMDPLQKRLQDVLKGKTYLLVLDDVWNEDQEKWDMLKYVLQCGSKGASVMVTTRLQMVASIVGTLPAHHLSGLSQDDCWLLFKQRAFGNDREELPNLVAIGKEIVNKCGGVPLAAKALGSLMCFKKEEKQWLHVKESEVWNLPQDNENSILPALRFSYTNLPLELRQCFAFCAIFPKDTVINKEDLILLWMANGFISPNGGLGLEDVGNQIWNELYWRSLVQDVKEDQFGNIHFKMHDLVHDLAQSVAEDEYCVMDAEWSTNLSSRVRHVNILYEGWQRSVPEYFYSLQSARTILQTTNYFGTSNKKEILFAVSVLSKLNSLRVFDARVIGMRKLPSSISSLRHLRYLDLSSNYYLRILPESICSLWNLQTLKLNYCWSLEKLPKHMRRLRNLRHLYIDGCRSLDHMPPDMRQMTCLKTLSSFIVGSKRRGCGLRLSELQGLDLGGSLRIKHLERVQNLGDAKEAGLIQKQNLRCLNLSWAVGDESESVHKKVLEGLEPHPDLKELVIEGYKGIHFPHWMNDHVLEKIVSVSLKDCKKCSDLPPFWKLPSLTDLNIEGMDNLEYILHNTQGHGHGPQGGMVALQNLKGLSALEGREIFPRLTNLYIMNCPKLTLPSLPSLKCLHLGDSNLMLLSSISNLTSLSSLSISGNNDMVSFPGNLMQNLSSLRSLEIRRFTKLEVWTKDPVSFNSLESLEISDCHYLECFSEQGLQGLNSLRRLKISQCKKFKSLPEGLQHLTTLECLFLHSPELVVLPDSVKHLYSLRSLVALGSFHSEDEVLTAKLVVLPEALQHVPALQSLKISHYPLLASLPDWLGNLTSLQSLTIYHCPKLTSLPYSIESISNLQTLSIHGCPELQRRCEKERGEDWSKIAHVPNIDVS